MHIKIHKTDEEWKKILPPDVYHVTREQGTEAPFTGPLLHEKRKGMYQCSNCKKDLFSSETKFDSGCGWPSFYEPIQSDAVKYIDDTRYGMRRVEVRCANCDAHLGHVFPDGPQDKTGKRFCMNSLALHMQPEKK